MARQFLTPLVLPADPANPLEAATKQYVDNNRTSAGRTFYLTNDASDIATYYKALDSPSSGAEATFAATVSGTTDFLLAAWATEPGIPGVTVFPAGTAYRRFYVNLAGGNVARLHLQIYVRNLAGTETLARDEFSPNFSNTTVALNEWLTSATSVGDISNTDRVVAKLYAQRVSGGASFAVTLYVEGTTHASHVQTTIVGGSSGAGTTLDGLNDVTVATPVDGQVLTYNTGTSQWQNEDPSGGTPVGTKLSALTAITGAILATLDLIEVVDVSDTTMAASGTNKKITMAELVTYLNGVVTVAAASETASGIVELATAAETLTGTDNVRAIHPAGAFATFAAKNTVVNAQTGTTYTLVLADAGKLVTLSNASAITLTVPLNSAVAYPIGTVIDLAQIGAGQVTVTQTGGVTVNATPSKLFRAQYSTATLIKYLTDTWLLVGDLA